MIYDFVKIHGAGNDFVFIEDLGDEVTLAPEQIARLCDRHFGIGADGVILVKPATVDGCDASMCYYNSDGTTAQMCGNGVRCFAKYLVDRGIVDASRGYVDVQTLAGPKHIEFELDDAGKLALASVDMGRPILEPGLVPTTLGADGDGAVVEQELDTSVGTFQVSCVSMGNPHCVIFMPDRGFFDDPDSFEISRIGSSIETDAAFPEKCNVEFAFVAGDGGGIHSPEILMRVWERGCGETFACGTGACATGVAAFLSGRSGRVNDLHLRGGTLHIVYREDGEVIMTGPAEESFIGKVEVI